MASLPGPSQPIQKRPKDDDGPSKYKPFDPVEAHRHQLGKLFKNFETPVLLPNEKKPKFERERSTGGPRSMSSSSRFHEYRRGRRKEYERQAIMSEQAKQEEDQIEFDKQKQEWKIQEESKTAKNREKRLRKKRKLQATGPSSSSSSEPQSTLPTNTYKMTKNPVTLQDSVADNQEQNNQKAEDVEAQAPKAKPLNVSSIQIVDDDVF